MTYFIPQHSVSPTPNPLSSTASPTLIVFGNEKGGSGKSTAAIQTAIGLLHRGYRVGTIDLDARQGTMTRYLRNRYLYAARTPGPALPCPLHLPIDRSTATTIESQKSDDRAFLAMAMEELGGTCDFIVIDTPGADTHLNRLAHGIADILVTPMNDSLIDLDVLASIDPVTGAIKNPSFYTTHVQTLLAEKERQMGRKTDWIVMRNRLSALDNHNKRKIQTILNALSHRHGFRLANGFGERLIYRDLFLHGLTISDLPYLSDARSMTASHTAAIDETNALIATINPKRYTQHIPKMATPAERQDFFLKTPTNST